MTARKLLRALVPAALVLAAVAPAAAEEPATVGQLGERIYTLGEGEGGRELTAVLGDGGAELPASMMPCSSCHGSDGRGRAEGGLSPSDVTWPALSRPYRTDTPSGRRPAPYDEYLVKRAVTMGIDSAGQPLHVAMPRYRLNHAEAAALVAYLRSLGEASEPGVTEDAVRLGVVLPPAGPLASLGEAVRAVLEAAAARTNAGGGLYNRRLELRFLSPGEPRADAVARFLDDEEIFALAASYLVGAEAEIGELLRGRGVPLVGPFAAYPQLDFPLNPQIFYLAAGLPQQARALVDFAARRLAGQTRRALVLHPRQGGPGAVVEAIRDQAGRHGGPWNELRALAYPPGRPEVPADGDVVFFLGSEAETAAFLRAADAAGRSPWVLLLGTLAGKSARAAPESFRGRVFLAYPSLATDVAPRGFANYRQLRADHGLPAEHVAGQVAALAAFELLVEGLERVGRELSREQLVAELEGVYEFDTALTPPLTYGPNRRIGAFGAHVVPPDFAGRLRLEESEWVALRD